MDMERRTGSQAISGARLGRLWRGERGTVTVEFVLWIPIFLIILAFTADACKLYLTQANMWDVARDTTRRMSIGQYCDATTAQTYAQGQLYFGALSYTFNVTKGTVDTVEISTPIASASVFGLLASYGGFSAGTLDAKVVMPSEPGTCTP
jgi:Flp pilus assembly protein TadG